MFSRFVPKMIPLLWVTSITSSPLEIRRRSAYQAGDDSCFQRNDQQNYSLQFETVHLNGGEDCPKELSPQQTMTPSARSPQVCHPPLLMDVNRSSPGGEA